MTPGQLRTFLALASTASVGAAAERLHVTQPAVSAVVAGLQRELGVTLIERDGRRIRLTAAGETLAAYGRQVVALLQEAREASMAAEHPEAGRLRLGAVNTAGEHLLPPLLASFRTANPGIELGLEVGNRQTVADLLRNHEVDVAVAGRPAGSGLRSVLSLPNPLVVVGTPAVAAAVAAGDGDLGARPWLLREPGSGTRATTLEYLSTRGVAPVQLTLGSNGAIRAGLLLDMGMTLISRDAVLGELGDGRLVQVPEAGPPLQRSWHVLVRAHPLRPPVVDVFLAHLERAGGFVSSVQEGDHQHLVASTMRR
jgi:LysR family transcriptional regulator, low CO2-responsive transcriptional regulator